VRTRCLFYLSIRLSKLSLSTPSGRGHPLRLSLDFHKDVLILDFLTEGKTIIQYTAVLDINTSMGRGGWGGLWMTRGGAGVTSGEPEVTSGGLWVTWSVL